MKKFFAIFGICFGSLVVFIGGFLGIKYLIGDFDPVIVEPKSIYFEMSEYYFDYNFDDSKKFYITVKSDTPNITEKKITLSLPNNNDDLCKKDTWCDGVIEIPREAYIGVPFEVELYKTSEYANEVNDGGLNSWVKGGISKIEVASKNLLDTPEPATVYVDTPVYKTELVVFNNSLAKTNFYDSFKNIESLSCATVLPNINNEESLALEFPKINESQKFYVGLKYYPQASTYKYNKISSTNFFVQYKNDIINAMQQEASKNNGFDIDLYNQIINLCNEESEKSVADILTLCQNLIDETAKYTDLNTVIQSKLQEFNNSLKFNYIQTLSKEACSEGVRIKGTNIFEFVAKQNLESHPYACDFFTYTYKHSNDEINANLQDYHDINTNLQAQQALEAKLDQDFASNLVERNKYRVNIIDVEADKIEISGSISPFNVDTYHTIYASEIGANDKANSYLRLSLLNTTTGVNLTHKISNIAVTFEKNTNEAINPWKATTDIKFDDDTQYETIEHESVKYYKPYGVANYWKIYADYNAFGEYRAVIKYFIEMEDGTYQIISLEENQYPIFNVTKVTSSSENMISWLNTDPVDLKIVNFADYFGEHNFIEEYDLEDNVNPQVNQNVYTTKRYFIYTNEEGKNLEEYFNVLPGVDYTLNDGKNYNLCEIKNASSILKVTNPVGIPDSVYAIFVTIRTNVKGTPVYIVDNKGTEDVVDDIYRYDIIKHSAYKETMLEIPSAIEFTFTNSLKLLSGELSRKDENNTQVFEEKIKTGKNLPNVFELKITCDESDVELFKQAFENGDISVVGKIEDKSVGYEVFNKGRNYITADASYNNSDNSIKCSISTIEDIGSEDITISLYIKYTLSGKNYYFLVPYIHDETSITQIEIVNQTESKAGFNFEVDDEYYDIDNKTINVTSSLSGTTYTTVSGEETKVINIFNKFNDSNELSVKVINFLGKEATSNNWYLQSFNTAVIRIIDNKKIEVVGSGTAKVNLYLDGVEGVQKSVTFVVTKTGYISAYSTYDANGTNSQTYEDGEYEKLSISLSVKGKEYNTITLWSDEEVKEADIQNNHEKCEDLFALWYTESGIKSKLKPTISLVEESEDAFEAIAVDEFNNISFTLEKNLGQTVVLKFKYTYTGNTEVDVTLTITEVVSVTSFEIKEDVNVINPISNSGTEKYTYNLYSGVKYSFKATLSSGTAQYYLKTGETYTELSKASIVSYSDPLYTFKDATPNTSYQIYITDGTNGADIAIGDLQHVITINVLPNIKLKNATSNVQKVELDADSKKTLAFSEIFAREHGNTKDSTTTYAEFGSSFKISTRVNCTNEQVKCDVTDDGTDTGTYISVISFDFSSGGISAVKTVTVTFTYCDKELNAITFNVYPCNFENATYTSCYNNNRIVTYNGQKAFVFAHGDALGTGSTVVSFLSTYFTSTNNGESTTSNQYTISNTVEGDLGEYLDNSKITITTNKLLTDTGKYFTVSDANGNSTKYKIIISQLPFPFVNLSSSLSNTELDIYKLFVSTDKQSLLNYYLENNIKTIEVYGGNKINLADSNSTAASSTTVSSTGINLVFKINKGENNPTFSYSFINSVLYVNDYVSEVNDENNELQTELIGEDTYLHVIASYKFGPYSYDIPAIIKINASQRLEVNYPHDNRTPKSIDDDHFTEYGERGWYGSEEYDNVYMTQDTLFGNAVMEYVEMGINGQSTLELSADRFTVQKYDGKDWINYTEYSGGYNFEISKVYCKTNNIWTNIENVTLYASVNTSGMLTIKFHTCTAVRVKVKVTTTNGGAVSYYYVQAGEVPNVELYTNNNTLSSETKAGSQETVQVSDDDVIVIGKSTQVTNAKAYFYLKENGGKLTYKINGATASENAGVTTYTINGLSICEVTNTDKTQIKILLSPNESEFTIDVYTCYGKLTTITVKVSAKFTAQQKAEVIYSSTQMEISDIVKIMQGANEQENFTIESADGNYDGYSIVSVDASGNVLTKADQGYDTATKKIRFNHSKTSYTIENFEVDVTVHNSNTYIFKVSLPNIEVQPLITANTDITNPYNTYSATSSGVVIDCNIWKAFFKVLPINSNIEAYGINYYYSYDNGAFTEVSSITEGFTISDIGIITNNTEKSLELQVHLGTSDNYITISAESTIVIQPQYSVTCTYSQGKTGGFTAEYVKKGSKINLEGKTINGDNRIAVSQNISSSGTSSGAQNYDLNCTSEYVDISGKNVTFNNEGDYEIQIKVADVVYGVYRVCVQPESPITIDDSNLNNQTFYAGYGVDKILNYVDVTLTLPSINITGNTCSIVYKDALTGYTSIKDSLYYYAGQTIRLAVPISTPITTSNIYMKYTVEEGETSDENYEPCNNVVITPRYQISYNGDEVDEIYYGNIIDTEKDPVLDNEAVEEKNITKYIIELKTKCDNSKNDVVNAYYNVGFDIELKEEVVETLTINENLTPVHYIMNANEFKEGISFIGMFEVKDLFGNIFNYNHAKLGTLNLAYQDSLIQAVDGTSLTGTLAPIKLEQQIYDQIMFDYNIIALGATNSGTIVGLTITYTVGTYTFTETRNIKIISDIIYSVLNNDTYDTPNSITNPLLITPLANATYLLADASQKGYNQNKYYIYAYGKYDLTQKNVAHSFKVNQSEVYKTYGVTNYGEKEIGDNLIFNVVKEPEFGDKDITLELVDNFGFKFNYYIKLIAETRINNINITNSASLFEGETIYVYNLNDSNANKGTCNIEVNLLNANGENDTTTLIIDSSKTTYNNNLLSLNKGTDTIIISEQSQEFWNGAQSKVIDFQIAIKKHNGSELYIVNASIVVYKRYQLSINEENTYVRDNVPFNIEHLVSVFDNKENVYLGEPTLSTTEALQLKGNELNDSFKVSGTKTPVSYTYESEKTDENATLELTNLNVYELMKARASETYTSSSIGAFVLKYTNSTELEIKAWKTDGTDGEKKQFNNKVADAILNALDIVYSDASNTFKIYVDVVAINKTSKAPTQSQTRTAYLEYVYNGTSLVPQTTPTYVYLGEESEAFAGLDITSANYDFEVKYFVFGSDTVTVGKLNSNVAEVNTIFTYGSQTHVSVTTAQITLLKVNVDKVGSNDAKVKICYTKENGETESTGISVTSDQNKIPLTQYANKEIKLYTGVKKEDGKDVTYLNGLSVSAARDFKHLYALKLTDEDGNSISSCQLACSDTAGTTYLYDEERGVYYQNVSVDLTYNHYNRDNTEFKDTETIRVTLKYTGIDASNAYETTADIHFIDVFVNGSTAFDINGNNIGSVTNNNSDGDWLINSGTLNLNTWASKFKAVPGIGNTAIFASYNEQGELNLNHTDVNSYITYKLKAVTNGGDTSKVEIGTNNDITLKAGFNLSKFYITLEARCKPSCCVGEPSCETDANGISIGTIVLGFRVYDNAVNSSQDVEVEKNIVSSSSTTTGGSTTYTPTDVIYNTANAKLTLKDINVYALMNARKNQDYGGLWGDSHSGDEGYLGSFELKYTNGTEQIAINSWKTNGTEEENNQFNNNVADAILNALNIKFESDSNFMAKVEITATNKNDSNDIITIGEQWLSCKLSESSPTTNTTIGLTTLKTIWIDYLFNIDIDTTNYSVTLKLIETLN